MKSRAFYIVAVVVVLAGRAEAANLAVITQPPNLLNLAIFVAACVAAVISSQIVSVVRGGFLSRSW